MIKLDIIVHPTFSEPELPLPEPKKTISWKFPWRINMLAIPKPPPNSKYKPPPLYTFKTFGPVDPATEFRADHLARPIVRKLVENKKTLKVLNPKREQIITKTIQKAWDSIYNYYVKRLRERRLKRLRGKLKRLDEKKPKGKELEKIENDRKERLGVLATPRKLFMPEKTPRQWKYLEDLQANIEALSTPKTYYIVPPREIGKVSPHALTYEITEAIAKLAQIPQTKARRKSEPILLGTVARSALTAKCTPRIEKLAQPSFSAREAKKQDEDKYDPWIISPNALKYKATARILELAKPLERE